MDPVSSAPEVENLTEVSSKKPIIFAILGLVLVVAGFLIYNFMFSVNRPPALAMKGGLQGLTTNIRTGFIEYEASDVSAYSAPEGLAKESFAAKNGVIYLYSDVDVNVKNILRKYIVPQNGMAAMLGYWSSAKNIFITSQNSIAAWQGQILILKDNELESGDGIIPAHTGFFIITNKASMDIYGVKSPVKAPVSSFDIVNSGNVGWNLVSVTREEYEKLNDVAPISIWKYAGGDFVREVTVDSSKLDNYLVWLEYNEKPVDIDARVRAEAEAKAEAESKVEAEAKAKAEEVATAEAKKAADDADVANAAAEEAKKALAEAIANAKNASEEAKVSAQKAVDEANLVAAQALKDKEDAESKLAEMNIALENALAQKESKAEQEVQAKAQKAQAEADAQKLAAEEKVLAEEKKKALAAENEKLAGWYDKAWIYRKSINIDSSKVYADFDNFPVLVKLSGDKNLIDFAQDNGADILFTTKDNPKVKLFHEIEKYDGTVGDIVAWVNIPKLSSESGAELYMYYGNEKATAQQNYKGVWGDNYAMVQHMNGNFYDSTKNKNNGTEKGNVSIDSNGKISEYAKFVKEATPNYISVADSESLNITDAITLSAWINTDAKDKDGKPPTNTYPGIVSKRSSSFYESKNIIIPAGGYTLALTYGLEKRKALSTIQTEDITPSALQSTSYVNDSKWHLVTSTYDGSSMKIYIDGNVETTIFLSGKIKIHTEPVFIGQLRWDGNNTHANYQYSGLMDEVRVSPKAMSDKWIRTEFENQNVPEAFYTVGSQEVF